MSSILKRKGVSYIEDNTDYEQIPEWRDENGELSEDTYEE